MKVERICENEEKQISCGHGKVLEIITASYGRSSNFARCGWSWTSCHAPDSLEIVQDLCQNKRSCLLKARNSVFGDPCRGVRKYLKIEFSCIQGATTSSDSATRKGPIGQPGTTDFTTASLHPSGSQFGTTGLRTTSLESFEVVDTPPITDQSANFEDHVANSTDVDWRIATSIAAGLILLLLSVLLTFLMLRRRRNVKADSKRPGIPEEKLNELYEMSPAYVAASDVTDPHDQNATYSAVCNGTFVRSLSSEPEPIQNEAYSMAVDAESNGTTYATMRDNILYGSR